MTVKLLVTVESNSGVPEPSANAINALCARAQLLLRPLATSVSVEVLGDAPRITFTKPGFVIPCPCGSTVVSIAPTTSCDSCHRELVVENWGKA